MIITKHLIWLILLGSVSNLLLDHFPSHRLLWLIITGVLIFVQIVVLILDYIRNELEKDELEGVIQEDETYLDEILLQPGEVLGNYTTPFISKKTGKQINGEIS